MLPVTGSAFIQFALKYHPENPHLQVVRIMKKHYFILSCIFFLSVIACSKNSIDQSSGSGSLSTNPATLPDSVVFYNTLNAFTKQGTTWDCVRFDTIGGTPLLGYTFHEYTGNWQKNLVFDTVNKQSPNYGTYRDSTIETFTIKEPPV